MKPKNFYIEEVLYAAKKFLKSNGNLQEPEENYWVDHSGNLLKVPKGMWFDARGDTLRFKVGNSVGIAKNIK